jgi:hypothetical protein
MWYVEVFESFKSCINLFKNQLSIYFAKFVTLSYCEKVGQNKFIWKFHSYVAFWKGLGHDLMNQTHAMHFSIISKNMFWMPNLSSWKTYFWGASHCYNPRIQISRNVYQVA